jgi:hypothetical protein
MRVVLFLAPSHHGASRHLTAPSLCCGAVAAPALCNFSDAIRSLLLRATVLLRLCLRQNKFKKFFDEGDAPSGGGKGDSQSLSAELDQMCKLSWRTRLIGFGCCCGIGILISILVRPSTVDV